jgi:hypothetical protein
VQKGTVAMPRNAALPIATAIVAGRRHDSRAISPVGHVAFRVYFLRQRLHSLTRHETTTMRTRTSESFIVLPLLPIFLLGVFPMLLLSLMGPAGLIILGILIVCAGFTDILEANTSFSEQLIVHGYSRGSERNGQRMALRSEMRFAALMIAVGAGLVGLTIA